MSKSSLALSNLRGIVIVDVLVFHSMLAYVSASPAPHTFNQWPFTWVAFPIVDTQRWFGFDLWGAWNDVFMMSMMFFLSGVFVWPSLKRKGAGMFLRDRLLRLGLPLVLVVVLLMPPSLYPSYLASGGDPSLAAYWQTWLSLPFWPCGPQWFLWQLLALDVLVAIVFRFIPRWGDALGQWIFAARDKPSRLFLALLVASAVAYIPLAIIFTPWSWLQAGPLAVQLCRPLQYLVYFFAGVGAGALGLDNGVLATDGKLGRRWPVWMVLALIGFGLWGLPTSQLVGEGAVTAPLGVKFAAGAGYVLCCAASCLFVLAVFLRFGTWRARMIDSLSSHAYGIYMLHYAFVVWLQYELLGASLPAVVKAAVVFAGTLFLTWGATIALSSVSLGGLVGTSRQAAAKVQ